MRYKSQKIKKISLKGLGHEMDWIFVDMHGKI